MVLFVLCVIEFLDLLYNNHHQTSVKLQSDKSMCVCKNDNFYGWSHLKQVKHFSSLSTALQ